MQVSNVAAYLVYGIMSMLKTVYLLLFTRYC